MENAIIENIERLYKGHIINLLLSLVLVAVTGLLVAGVVKFKILNARWKNIALVSLVAVCSVALLLLQISKLVPVYKDYTEQSYIVVENAEVVIKESTVDMSDRVNRVVVYDGEKEFELQMQIDHSLDTWFGYKGKIAYLEHSNYMIWYDFE